MQRAEDRCPDTRERNQRDMTMTLQRIFSDQDKAQIEERGLSVEQAMEQIRIFREGAAPLKLNRPCTLQDGIFVVGEEEGGELVRLHEEEAGAGRMLKFVPASGAASRMFKDWYRILDAGGLQDEDSRTKFLRDLKSTLF